MFKKKKSQKFSLKCCNLETSIGTLLQRTCCNVTPPTELQYLHLEKYTNKRFGHFSVYSVFLNYFNGKDVFFFQIMERWKTGVGA